MYLQPYQKKLLFITRILFGGLFLWSGLNKVTSGFTASGYLINATTGPFMEFFQSLAGSPIVDSLVIYGEVLIGIALVTGLFVRFASAMTIIMMSLFYLSAFPPEHGLISEHIIYILVAKILAAFGAGRLWGIDGLLEKQPLVKEHFSIFRYLLG